MDSAARTRIVEHASDQGTWRMALRSPEPRLAASVVSLNAYDERGTGPSRRRELPSGLATLVFNLGADLGVSFPGEAARIYGAGGAFFSGPGSRYAVTETGGSQTGAQVMLTPLGARRLAGRPLEEVGDTLIDPADLLGADARILLERLQEANGEERRLMLLQEAMERRITQAAPIPTDLAWAVHQLRTAPGRVRIDGLAAAIGCSRKHLGIRFRREFGMAPKLFARTVRFGEAARRLEQDRVGSLADIAADCGYADQAHMTRDFVGFAGSPPAAFLARRLPDEGGFRD